MNIYIPTREVVEKIKDIICTNVDGCVYDYYVAEVLKMDYSALRTAISKDKMPVDEVVLFCYKEKLVVNDFIFKKNT